MEEKKLMRYCKICAEKKDDMFGLPYHVPGYIETSIYKLQNNKCLKGHDTIELSMPCDDYKILTRISTDPNFMSAMVELCEKDVIEYNLKMSQFKQQVQQQESDKSTVKCPYCHSANIKKISGMSKAGAVALFGIFAIGKTSKQWHCNSCGSDF